jgi:hypothetical protein
VWIMGLRPALFPPPRQQYHKSKKDLPQHEWTNIDT